MIIPDLSKPDRDIKKEHEHAFGELLKGDKENIKVAQKLAELHDSMFNAPNDAEAAANVLKLAAEYLREAEENRILPVGLGKYLAVAFEVAASKDDPKQRAKMLGVELHLTALNRRPLNDYDIGSRMLQLMYKGCSQNEAAIQTGIDLDVSESAAKLSFKKFSKIFENEFSK
jgi:hypothetical protein